MGDKSKTATKQTEWRIIGVSGETADGREINARELKEMAEQYDPEVYGARINLEHYQFLFPRSSGGGYGDVLELKAVPWEKDKSKTALMAKLSVMPSLQALWDSGQKIYTSMEIVPKFADTNKAYLVGLAITDTPASLGTTANFSVAAQKAELDGAILTPYRVSDIQDLTMTQNKTDTQEQDPKAAETVTAGASGQAADKIADGVFSRLVGLFKTSDKSEHIEKKEEKTEEKADYSQQLEALQKEYAKAAEFGQLMADKFKAQSEKLAELEQAFADLKTKLETEVSSGEREEHTGGSVGVVGW